MVAYSDIVLEPKGTSSAVATKTEEVVDTSLGTLLTNVSSIGSRVLKAAGEGAATDSYLSANKALEAESKEFANDPEWETKTKKELEIVRKIPRKDLRNLQFTAIRRDLISKAGGDQNAINGINQAMKEVTGFNTPTQALLANIDSVEKTKAAAVVTEDLRLLNTGKKLYIGTDAEIINMQRKAESSSTATSLLNSKGGETSQVSGDKIRAAMYPALEEYSKTIGRSLLETKVMPLVRIIQNGTDIQKEEGKRVLSGLLSSTQEQLFSTLHNVEGEPINLNRAELGVALKEVNNYLKVSGLTADDLNTTKISERTVGILNRMETVRKYMTNQKLLSIPEVAASLALVDAGVKDAAMLKLLVNVGSIQESIKKAFGPNSNIDAIKGHTNSINYILTGQGTPSNVDKAKLFINQHVAMAMLKTTTISGVKQDVGQRIVESALNTTTTSEKNNPSKNLQIKEASNEEAVAILKKLPPEEAMKLQQTHSKYTINQVGKLIEAARAGGETEVTFSNGTFVSPSQDPDVQDALEEANTLYPRLARLKMFGPQAGMTIADFNTAVTGPMLNSNPRNLTITERLGNVYDTTVDTIGEGIDTAMNNAAFTTRYLMDKHPDAWANIQETSRNITGRLPTFEQVEANLKKASGIVSDVVQETIKEIDPATKLKDLISLKGGKLAEGIISFSTPESTRPPQDKTNTLAARNEQDTVSRVNGPRAVYFGGAGEFISQLEDGSNRSVFTRYRDSSANSDITKSFTDAIGFGHQLTAKELKQGFILIKGDANKSARGIPGFIGDEDIKIDFTDGITREEAVLIRDKDIGWASKAFLKSLKKAGPSNENMEVAGTSLLYNIGEAAWDKSEAKKNLEAGDYEGFMLESFSARKGWVKSWQNLSGQKVHTTNAGLIARRTKELELFKLGMSEPMANNLPKVKSKPPQPPAVPEITPQTLEEDLTEMKTEQAVDTYLKSMIETGVSLPTLQYMADTSNPNVSVSNRIALRAAIDRYEKEQEDVGI
jgi:GH24 family phage-related lysozyme (muramidase)